MDAENIAPGYYIWGIDNTAYGPVELPPLVAWIKEERVIADTWIFVEDSGEWFKAADVPELKMFFKARPNLESEMALEKASAADFEIKPGTLRRIKAFTEMTEVQLNVLLQFTEVVRVGPFAHMLHRGDPPDAMYGVLEGELRSSIIVDGKECPLSTLAPGSIFGEISLFDRGPHTVHVISNQESVLIKLSNTAISRITKEAPDVGLALLSGLIKSIAGRVRTLTRRYEDSVHIANRSDLRPAAFATVPAQPTVH